jgi:CBS domain-containing protein
MRHTAIREYMSAAPLTVLREVRLSEARQQMEQQHCRHLPVLRESKVIGMLTLHAIDQVAALAHDQLTRFVAGDAMTEVLVVDGAVPLGQVLSAMIERQNDAAVITVDGVVAGIFTTVDALTLLRTLVSSRTQ